MPINTNQVADSQISIAAWLGRIPRVLRILLGLFGSATFALYISLLMLALAGHWINVLMMWSVNAVIILFLAIINAIADRFNKALLVATALAIVFDVYAVDVTIRNWDVWGLAGSWQNFVYVNATLALNAFLWLRYKKVANL